MGRKWFSKKSKLIFPVFSLRKAKDLNQSTRWVRTVEECCYFLAQTVFLLNCGTAYGGLRSTLNQTSQGHASQSCLHTRQMKTLCKLRFLLPKWPYLCKNLLKDVYQCASFCWFVWLFKVIVTTILGLGYSQYILSSVDMVWVVLFYFLWKSLTVSPTAASKWKSSCLILSTSIIDMNHNVLLPNILFK